MRKLTRRAAEQAGGMPRVPVMVERESEKRVGVVLVTGDRGLAGAFNTNIIRDGMRLGDELRGSGVEPVFSAVGRKGVGALTFRKQEVTQLLHGLHRPPRLRQRARDRRGADRALRRRGGRPGRAGLQPLRLAADPARLATDPAADAAGRGDRRGLRGRGRPTPRRPRSRRPTAAALWEYEPEAEELLAQLIPEYVNISVYRALLESAASELGARMTAMRNAAENAETMMEDLTLEMNRARQAEITQEILEVVSGAEALG